MPSLVVRSPWARDMRILGQNFGSHGQRCKFWQKLHEKKWAKLHTVGQRREDAGPKWKESRLTSEHCAATENSTVGWLTRKRPVNILCFLLHNITVEWVIQGIADVFARRLFLALKWKYFWATLIYPSTKLHYIKHLKEDFILKPIRLILSISEDIFQNDRCVSDWFKIRIKDPWSVQC